MKGKILVILVVLPVLVSLFSGCSPKQDSHLIDILKILPGTTISVEYTGVELLAEDPDLEDIYNELTESIYGSFAYLFGIDFSDIHAITIAGDDEYQSWLMVTTGEFDIQNVRDALTDYPEHEFVQDTYEGVEFWIGDPDSDEPMAVAFLEEMLLFGEIDHVKDVVRVTTNEKASIYDNQDVKAVVAKLPIGIQTEIYIGKAVYDVPALAGGTVLFNSIQGDGKINAEGYYRFESAADAQATMQDLKDFYYWWNTTNIDAQLKGQFIEITGEVDNLDMLRP